MILTPEGKAFAEEHADESIVCRVALIGYGSDWPIIYVDAAINTCNRQAEKKTTTRENV
jgi:hypothetical protein